MKQETAHNLTGILRITGEIDRFEIRIEKILKPWL